MTSDDSRRDFLEARIEQMLREKMPEFGCDVRKWTEPTREELSQCISECMKAFEKEENLTPKIPKLYGFQHPSEIGRVAFCTSGGVEKMLAEGWVLVSDED